MQMVILAGGLATRLRPITQTIPKSMVPIEGKPFLHYQLELLRQHGALDIVLCVGHLWRQIEAYFGDGADFGVRLSYSVEEGKLLGTAGALKHAENLLHDRFFLMYGDSYLMYDYADVMEQSQGWPALMVVYRNQGRYDVSNVAIENGRVVRYEKGLPPGEIDHIDAGLSVLTREALDPIPAGIPSSLDQALFPKLAHNGQLGAYITTQRFYEIGSPPGLEEFTQYVRDVSSAP